MEHSPLDKLPPEIRNKKCELALHSPGGVILTCTKKKVSAPKSTLALAHTCRQLRHKTLTMFFACNEFVFQVPYFANYKMRDFERAKPPPLRKHLKLLPRWIERISKTNAAFVRTMTIDFGTAVAEVFTFVDTNIWRRHFRSGWGDLWSIVRGVENGGRLGDRAIRVRFNVSFLLGDGVVTAGVPYDIPLDEADKAEAKRLCGLAVEKEREGVRRRNAAATGRGGRGSLSYTFAIQLQEGVFELVFE